MSSSRNNRNFEMVFLIRLLNKAKVLIPCEISIITNIHSSYFIYFSHSKILGCDRLPPLKEISSPRFGETRKKDGFLGTRWATTLKRNFVGSLGIGFVVSTS
jgi:hypothetical protein